MIKSMMRFRVVAILLFTACAAAAQGRWVTHTDPAGFTIKAPEGWTVASDAQSGRVNLRGPQGEASVVWPVYMEQRSLDARGAQAVAAQLAHSIDPQLPWSTPELNGNIVRLTGRAVASPGNDQVPDRTASV